MCLSVVTVARLGDKNERLRRLIGMQFCSREQPFKVLMCRYIMSAPIVYFVFLQ